VSVTGRVRTRIVEDAVDQSRLRIGSTEIAHSVRQASTRSGDLTVLVLHGFTGQGGDWAAVCDELAAAGHGSICPDHPGHGSSEAPDAPDPYTMEALADTYRVLCEHVVAGPVVIDFQDSLPQ
jgi:alpha-beta hydrolase superfamily lysophospholipase